MIWAATSYKRPKEKEKKSDAGTLVNIFVYILLYIFFKIVQQCDRFIRGQFTVHSNLRK